MAETLFDEAETRGLPAGTWTVADLSTHMARVVADAFPDDVWIAGQIRNLNRSAAGHVYFDLVEPTAGGEIPKAQIAVTLLAPERQAVNDQLTRAGGAVRMTDGIEVRIGGRIRWYGRRGIVQLRMHRVDPAFTIGRLQEDRDRILMALSAEGLLDRNAGIPIPLVPLRVGLVTSRGSAAHADVLATLTGSGIGFTVREVDARMQGPDCGPQVVRAMKTLSADGVDVILLTRGGGARTDLAGFDTEMVARAIAELDVPVFTGIGHETDRSIADDVAHTAHKTPTAAATHVVERVRAFAARLDRHADALHHSVERAVRTAERSLANNRHRAATAATRSLGREQQRLARVPAALRRAAVRSLDRGVQQLTGAEARVNAHDPALAMARGWSITTTEDGRLVRAPRDAPPGTRLVTTLAGGTLHSTVDAPLDPDEPKPQEQQ